MKQTLKGSQMKSDGADMEFIKQQTRDMRLLVSVEDIQSVIDSLREDCEEGAIEVVLMATSCTRDEAVDFVEFVQKILKI